MLKTLPLLFVLLLVGCSSNNTQPECTPTCADAVCGEDGCGGTCGDCAAGTVCNTGACTTCGNGQLEEDETCDDSADIACPPASYCESDNTCWIAAYSGSPETCDAECVTTGIEECMSGDDCCPVGCNPGNDVDCAPEDCGNGQLDPGESCDPPQAACPEICEPTHACESADLWGYEAACSLECKRQEITTCSPTSDGCCPPSCTDVNDADCDPAVCGDMLISGRETCDTGIAFPAVGSCSPDCDDNRACTIDLLSGSVGDCSVICSGSTRTECTSGDGCCPPNCTAAEDTDCNNVMCGDGVVDGTEGCDMAVPAGEPGSCPTSNADCDDNDPCTDDSFTGVAADCSASCVNQPKPCAGGDGCCPYTCTPNNDSECADLNLCESYCFDAITYCIGANELFASTSECENACQDMPIGRDQDDMGDSIYCRLTHLNDARSDADTHCPHVDVVPVGGCE